MNARDFVNYFRNSRVVRVAVIYIPLAWVTLRAILIAKTGLDAPEWVPKLIGILLLIGYPVALIISWAMDVGDEEEAREAAVGKIHVPGGSIQHQNQGTNPRTFGAFLFVGLAILGTATYFMLNSNVTALIQPTRDMNSVAVLPFLNLSSKSDHQIFCDGLSEELLNLLTGVDSLQVAARTSSFSLRESELDIPAIGKKLHVSHVLEGSVRRDDNRIRVTAQLVRSSDGYHVWSENYDREFTQIFEIQDDIAQNIVARLVRSLDSKSAFDQLPDVPRTDPEAYFAYLKGRGVLTYSGRDKLWEAAQHFESALEMSPTYQPAIIGQVYVQTLLGLSNGQPLDYRRDLFTQSTQLFEASQQDAWAAAAASVIGLSLYEWERTRDILELGLGAYSSDAGLAVLYAELLLILDDVDGAEQEIKRIESFAPGVAATAYLQALVDYRPSKAALENLFVLFEDSRTWNTAVMPGSLRDARQQLFRDCSAADAASGSYSREATACDALGSFAVPLLLLNEQESAAMDKLIAMVEAREFDGALVALPEVSALLAQPEAASARGILDIPVTRPESVLAQPTL